MSEPEMVELLLEQFAKRAALEEETAYRRYREFMHAAERVGEHFADGERCF